MHRDWCGKPCSECKTSCAADESIPCSPDCVLLNADGEPDNLRECLESGCNAIICIDKIQDAVEEEAKAYREKTVSLSSEEVYDKYFDIHIVQEVSHLICNCYEDFENDTNIIFLLYTLSAKRTFLSEFLNWVYSLDSIDVSNTEKTYSALRDFCNEMTAKP